MVTLFGILGLIVRAVFLMLAYLIYSNGHPYVACIAVASALSIVVEG